MRRILGKRSRMRASMRSTAATVSRAAVSGSNTTSSVTRISSAPMYIDSDAPHVAHARLVAARCRGSRSRSRGECLRRPAGRAIRGSSSDRDAGEQQRRSAARRRRRAPGSSKAVAEERCPRPRCARPDQGRRSPRPARCRWSGPCCDAAPPRTACRRLLAELPQRDRRSSRPRTRPRSAEHDVVPERVVHRLGMSARARRLRRRTRPRPGRRSAPRRSGSRSTAPCRGRTDAPRVAGRWLRFMPTSSSTPLPVSTSEWMPSESIAELPVTPATTNLVTAIATFAAMAP